MKIPPTKIKGEVAIQTRAILQEYAKEIAIPITIVKITSPMIAIVSDVSPFNLEISSDNTLLKTPGALSLLSNQAMFL